MSDVVAAANRIVVVAASAGGIPALITILRALPKNFPAPIVIVQHRLPDGRSRLASLLSSRAAVRVTDAQAGHLLEAGGVYTARSDLHLTITNEGRFAYSDGHRIRHVLSSANPLFESAAEVFGAGAIGVVLSGTGSDGADGVEAIGMHGGAVIAQDKSTSEFFGMPASAIATGVVDYVLPIHEIAPALVRLIESEPPLRRVEKVG